MVVGLGMDLIDVERVARMIERDGQRVTSRLLTEGEWAYCSRMASVAEHVAGRLAAKEAAFKALSGSDDARAISWRELEVVHDDHRRPSLRLHGRAAARAEALGITRTHLTISHSRQSAGAVVILERDV